jgi:hypothetical protein
LGQLREVHDGHRPVGGVSQPGHVYELVVRSDMISLPSILFELLNFTKEEKGQHFANIGQIADCVTSAETWACNRKKLFEALGGSDTSIGLDVCTQCRTCCYAGTYRSLETYRRDPNPKSGNRAPGGTII